MRMNDATRAIASWVAILAILMSAMAPTLSHAFGIQKNLAWLEVCTSVGAKRVASDDGARESAPAPANAHPLEHCPYCSLHTDLVLIPPGSTISLLLLALSQEFPAAFLAAPRTLHAWIHAQPRAPPFKT